MRIIAAFIILMVCGLSAAGQRDSVIVNDGWRKDTIHVKGQVIDTLGKETEMIIWDNTVRESEEERRNNVVKPPLDSRVFNTLSGKVLVRTSFAGIGTGSISGS